MDGRPRFSTEDSLEELAALADTAGIEVTGGTYQRLERIQPATYIGKGKVEELKGYRDDLDVDVFLFDDELFGEDDEPAGAAVEPRAQVLLAAVVFTRCGGVRFLEGLNDHFRVETLLAPDLLDGLIEVAAHDPESPERTSPEL